MRAQDDRRVFHGGCWKPLWKTGCSAKSFKKIRDKGVEISVLLSKVFDLSNRVNDGGVMLAAEASADFRE